MLCGSAMRPRHVLLALVPPVCWGAGFTIAKPAISHFPPLFMMTLVYAAIAAALTLVVRGQIRTSWQSLSLIAAFGITIQGAFMFMALRHLPAGVASLIIQIQVPIAVVLGWQLGGDPFSWRKLGGTLVATVGVVLVVGLPSERPAVVPVLMMVSGALFWAIGQVLARKLGRDEGVLLLKGLAIAGLPQLILATLLLEQGQLAAVQTADPLDWAALGFVAVVGFLVAYAVWFTLLRLYPVDAVAPFVLLMPAAGILTASVVLHETILAAQLIGGAVIIVGLAIVTLPHKNALRSEEPA